LASVKKELQQAKTDNAALVHYINASRRKEDWRNKEAHKKEEGQSSKGLFPPAS
jgi:hypothetical protein